MSLGDRPDIIGVDDASFEEFVAGSSGRLFTMAILLTGRHRAEAEDLLQDVLERAYRRWGSPGKATRSRTCARCW